ncbi:MAG: bis(5'-nucleosyl)-tetraphosphatase (symmetrical) YqeK [Bacilli bacterium]|nr:bis(5'-nucleosyl)-tetraphosphatase (symmetrical) YqeK [Bacilli bacterium]MBN2876807.1 bis(5'-nucleosyl)-tetraphosphatase (symmetrical) YqeK [Bacilli bacterium]
MITKSLIEEVKLYLDKVYHKDSHRRKHIDSMKQVAVTLAELYHADIPSVVVASYLHDATKYLSDEENKRLAGRISDQEVPSACLHAYSAAVLAKVEFGIEDEDILNAIRYHCSGRKQMSLLEKIIYIADYIEEGRPFVTEDLRVLAISNLDKALLVVMQETKEYLNSTNQPLSPLTEEAILYYQNELEEWND